jgi:hypothetical protein
VEAAVDVVGGHAGGGQADVPDRHVAAIGDDDDRVREDAQEREAEARIGAVHPERGEEQAECPGEQRQPEHLDGADVGVESRLGGEAEDQRREEQPGPAQLDDGEVLDPPAGQQSEQEPEEDAADQHRVMMLERTCASSGPLGFVQACSGAWDEGIEPAAGGLARRLAAA